MSTDRIKIEVNALKEGMFVADLDRPWHETPFPLQGFYIRIDDDVKALCDYCKYVYVDQKKQRPSKNYDKHAEFNPAKTEKRKVVSTSSKEKVLELPPIVIKSPCFYEVSQSISKEVSKVEKLHRKVYESIDHIFSSIEQGGQVSIKETKTVANGMVDSVIRNPDALVWLAKMHKHDAHTYHHSVNASVWALVFGRHLGLSKSKLQALAIGVLLSQVGKIKLDQDLVSQYPNLDEGSLESYQKYVDYSVEMVADMDELPNGVSAIVEFHQERHNGSGFPKGVSGEKIPLLAKIAGLVDYYQTIITPRDDELGLSPVDAVAKLYEFRNILFQQDLVERFIEAVGVYPTGTMVELSTKEIAIVTGHNQTRRLLPRVLVVTDDQRQALKNGRTLDLRELSEKGKSVYIVDSLPKGELDIDETQYLLTGATSKWSWRHLSGMLSA